MESSDDTDINSDIDTRFNRSAWCPPAHGGAGGHADDLHCRRSFVLLDRFAYLDDRRNATTASCELRDGKGAIHVTFFIADPPLVSYFCAHCTGGLLSDLVIEPNIVATEGSLVLLRVEIGCGSEYFIYHAGVMGQDPSLTQLPRPPSRYIIPDSKVTIVRHCSRRPHAERRRFTMGRHGGGSAYHDCRDCKYVIAALYPAASSDSSCHLRLFHSQSFTWSSKDILVADRKTVSALYTTNKVITVGGELGTVGWVDLWHGIFFCDVLDESPAAALRYVALPPPFPGDETVREGCPRPVRDIAVVNGFIKYVDLQVRVVPGSTTRWGDFTADGWAAAKWSMEITDTWSEPWRRDCVFDTAEISDGLPMLQVDAGRAQPTMQRLHVGHPTISLQDGGDAIVHFLSKVDYRDQDHESWVLAVDMTKKMIVGVAEFGADRTMGFMLVYIASRISEYLKVN